MDGTLYRFKDSETFIHSSLSKAIKKNIFEFLAGTLKVPSSDIANIYQQLKERYDGHISLGIEKEYGIDRKIYFNNTWNIDPTDFIDKRQSPRAILLPFINRFAILTEAPMIWAEAVLKHLDIFDLVDGRIFTGDSMIRKPSIEAFLNIKNLLDDGAAQIYSVGDQEETDILPAKKIGLKTIKIGLGQTTADYQINSIHDLPKIVK